MAGKSPCRIDPTMPERYRVVAEHSLSLARLLMIEETARTIVLAAERGISPEPHIIAMREALALPQD